MSENTRKGRIFPVTFTSQEEKEAFIAYAERVHHLKLAQLIRQLLHDDKAKREPPSPS